MHPKTRQLAKDLLPPLITRRLRSARAGRAARQRASVGGPNALAAGSEADADWYDRSFVSEHGDVYKRPYWELNWYAALSVVADRITAMPDPRVLDMGCGPAPLAVMLRDRGVKHYVGFDFSAARLDYARDRVPEFRFELADAYTTDLFETVDYDVVVATEFLEHVSRDLFVLDRIKPRTRVLANVPNYPSPSHVRIFKDEADVARRYASRFDDFRCMRMRNVSGSTDFVFDGHLSAAR
jgi:trans-aconitate methyltransferase